MENAEMGSWLEEEFDVTRVVSRSVVGDLGVVLENVLTRRECQRVVAETERLGYGDTNYPRSYRGNRRLQLHDTSGALAEKVWRRLRGHLPARLTVDWMPEGDDYPRGTWEPVACNARFRFSKYFAGDRFDVHADSLVCFGPDRFGLLTVNIYLNDLEPEQRGRTRFFLERQGEPVDSAGGSAGSLVLFKQESVLHDGEPLASGLKYLMRTDVVFVRVAE